MINIIFKQVNQDQVTERQMVTMYKLSVNQFILRIREALDWIIESDWLLLELDRVEVDGERNETIESLVLVLISKVYELMLFENSNIIHNGIENYTIKRDKIVRKGYMLK